MAVAVAVDGHNWMYPVAYGFMASETTDNWTWFMEQLKKAIGDPPLLAICFDACKGLENAVKAVYNMESVLSLDEEFCQEVSRSCVWKNVSSS